MKTNPLLSSCLLSALLGTMSALTAAQVTPTSDPAIRAAMQSFLESKEIAGAVTLVATPRTILHLDTVGYADVAGNRSMTADTLFWIASMTKPITGVAIMMLQDAGRLSLDDPVEKHLPEFKGIRTPDGKPAQLTIRSLLTHTSGLGEISGEEARQCRTLADAVARYVRRPLQFQPGARWQYCQSSINTAARIVEVISGESFPDFLENRLFRPLGMRDTTFYPSAEQLKRLAVSYRRTEAGELEPSEIGFLLGLPATSRERFPAGNGGLFSTAPDYARFCQMIAHGGEWAGRRYLSPASVKYMTSVRTGELKTGFTEGNGWGIGWCVVREPQGVTAMLSPGSHGHGGAYGTQAWIDPVRERIYVLMVQRANFPNSDNSEVRKEFQALGAKLQ
ncbi:MAG: beta-lactamase family protein [Verrucomicrobia bacterium]|nr:beta-lactamase family protein [Verrucomicrobiota bacterium]